MRQSGTLLVVLLLLVALDYVRQVPGVHHLHVLPQSLPLLQAVEDQREPIALEQLSGNGPAPGVLAGRREERVDRDLKRVFDHVRDDPGKQRRAQLQTGIVVHLDQPGAELLVDHEVQPEDLESELPPAAVEQRMHRPYGICCQPLRSNKLTIILGYTFPAKEYYFYWKLLSRYFSKSANDSRRLICS